MRGGARRRRFLKNLPRQRDSLLLTFPQDANQPCFLVVEIFFGIDAPVDGEPASVGYHVEIRSTAALPADHQDGVSRARRSFLSAILGFGFCADVMVCRALFYFSF